MEENRIDEALGNFEAPQIHPLLMLRDVIKNIWIVILSVIIAASWAYMATDAMYSPVYNTNTTFVVSSRNGSTSVYSNLSAAKDLAASFTELINSDVMKKQVMEELGVKKLKGTINAEVLEETNLLEMQVTAPTPRQAFLMTSAILNNYEELTDKVLNNVALEILSPPTVPVAPSNSNSTVRNAELAGIAAAILVIGCICISAYMRDTVKTVEEVEQKLDTRLLATVAHERKYKNLREKIKHKKKSILITNSTTSFAFAETFKKLRTRLGYLMRKNNFKTIMVTSVMEDEGKSTTAVNIALAMNRQKKNVLLIDADMKKPSIHKIMEYQEEQYASIVDLLEEKATLRQTLLTDKDRQIGLILGRNGTGHSTELISSPKMKELIEQARKNVDVVIIDTPPMSVSPDAECIADLVDSAILVVRQDMTPTRIINDAIDTFENTNAELLGCVFNNVRKADISENYRFGSGGKYGYGKYGKYSKYNKYGYGKYTYTHRNEVAAEKLRTEEAYDEGRESTE